MKRKQNRNQTFFGAQENILFQPGDLFRLILFSMTLVCFLFAMVGFSYAADQALINAAKKEGKIEIYTSLDRRYLDPIGKLFKKMYNLGDDFQVVFTRKATGPVIQMVEAEKMAGKSRWDIVTHSDESTFLRWIDEGLLLKYQPPDIANIRDEFRDPLGYRVAPYIGMTCIAINTAKVPKKDWPKTYKDLLDPKWKKRIGLADPNRSGPVSMFTKFIYDLYGWDYFRALGRNQVLIVGGNPQLEQLFLGGEIDVALCPNEYSLLMRIAEGNKNIKIIYPDEGAAFFVMWAGINKDAPRPNAAKLFFEYYVSDKCEKLLSDSAGRYITSKNVKMRFERPPMKFHKVDWKWLSANKTKMLKEFDEAISKGRAESK
jgi:iron(III) transport system substrate-binding protein